MGTRGRHLEPRLEFDPRTIIFQKIYQIGWKKFKNREAVDRAVSLTNIGSEDSTFPEFVVLSQHLNRYLFDLKKLN